MKMKTNYILPLLIVLSFGCNAEKSSSRRREVPQPVAPPAEERVLTYEEQVLEDRAVFRQANARTPDTPRIYADAPAGRVALPAPSSSTVDVVVIESNQLGHPPNWARVSTADGRTFLLDTWQPIGKRMRHTILPY